MLGGFGQRLGLGMGLGLIFSSACRDPGIQSRVGEIHLHQYPTGSHVSVLFVDPPTPIEKTDLDSALPRATEPVYTRTLDDATCKVFMYMSCGNNCPSNKIIDGGPVSIDGLTKPVKLAYYRSAQGYNDVVDYTPVPPGGIEIMVRGDGAGSIPPFMSELHTGPPIQPTTTLESGLGEGLEVSWSDSGAGDLIKILLNVNTPDASSSVICTLPEEKARFRVPDETLQMMPPAPRQLQLEVSRYRIVDIPVGEGRSVVLHGGYSVLSATMEP